MSIDAANQLWIDQEHLKGSNLFRNVFYAIFIVLYIFVYQKSDFTNHMKLYNSLKDLRMSE